MLLEDQQMEGESILTLLLSLVLGVVGGPSSREVVRDQLSLQPYSVSMSLPFSLHLLINQFLYVWVHTSQVCQVFTWLTMVWGGQLPGRITTPGQVVWDDMRKQTGQAMGSKSWDQASKQGSSMTCSSVPASTYPPWAPALKSRQASLQPETERNHFPSTCFWSWYFISVTESLTKTKWIQKEQDTCLKKKKVHLLFQKQSQQTRGKNSQLSFLTSSEALFSDQLNR